MQLFITPFVQDGDHISITEERVVHQLTKVLRAKKGDQIAVQHGDKRVVCSISTIGKMHIEAQALYEEIKESSDSAYSLAIALPNKFEKIELIVQKCTEIGIEHLIFFPAKHSVLKEISPSKMERLEKISLEAVEQSRGRKIPSTSFEKDIFSWCAGKRIFVAHQGGESLGSVIKNNVGSMSHDLGIIMVGPEGGRHMEEEEMFKKLSREYISFGKTILRTETASIIAGRIIKNIFS